VEIIDPLEIVEVDQEEYVPPADERRRSRHRFQRVEDHPPGGEIRQRIPRRLPPELPQPGCCSNLAYDIPPLFIEPTNDKRDDAKCQQEGQKGRFGKRYPPVRLGQLRDEKEQVVLKGEQCRDEHGHSHQEYILQA